MSLGSLLLLFAQAGILLYFLTMNGLHLVLLLRAYFGIKDHVEEVEADPLHTLFEGMHTKPITLICPAYNEGAGVVASVGSLLGLRYPEFQVVVVNDGSKDDTLEKLVETFRMRPSQRVLRQLIPTAPVRAIYESAYAPNLIVVDKENGGKSDALNCGLNLARYPLVCCMDGDSILEPDALLKAARPFMDEQDVLATGGVIRPLNGCKVTSMGIRGIHLPGSWLARFQIVEYLRAFLFGRVGLASMDAMFIVSGAFGLFRKEALVQAGGFLTRTIGEDFEMVVRLHRLGRESGKPYRITLVPDPICWTEVPEDATILERQRNRWQRGLLDTLWMHRKMWFNPAYGRLGLFSMPYFLLFEALAPLIETGGYLIFLWQLVFGGINTPFAILFFIIALLLGILNSLVALILQEMGPHRYRGLRDWSILLTAGIIDNFGFRQRTLLWRLKGTWDWLRGRQGWGHMVRKGIPIQGGPGA